MNVSNATVLSFEDARLEVVKRRIEAAQKRIRNDDWVEGSIELMLAVREAKDLLPPNKLVKWLELNVTNICANYASGLIYLSHDLDLARKALAASSIRNYYRIWSGVRDQYKHCLPEHVTNKRPANRGPNKSVITKARAPKLPRLPRLPRFGAMKPRPRASIQNLFRIQKLGADVVEKIKNTSLGYAKEMDELVILNGGAESGELTPVVAQLVADAVAGKAVSALAIASRVKRPPLQQAWMASMVFAWQVASYDDKQAFTLWLMNELGDRPPKEEDHE